MSYASERSLMRGVEIGRMLGDPIGRAIAAKAQKEYEDVRRAQDNEIQADRFIAHQQLQRELAAISNARAEALQQRNLEAQREIHAADRSSLEFRNRMDNVARIEAAKLRPPASSFSFNDPKGVLGPTTFDRRTGAYQRLTPPASQTASVDFSGAERDIAATRKEIAAGNKYTWMPDFLGRMVGAETTEQKLARQLADLEKAKRLGNAVAEQDAPAAAPQAAPAPVAPHRSAFEIPPGLIDTKAPAPATAELTPDDKDALAWAQANPDDPRAQAIIDKINAKMGR